MIVGDLLYQIQMLGYELKLVGENIKLTYTNGDPPKEAIPILKEFKAQKAKIVEYLRTKEPQPARYYEPKQHDWELNKRIGLPDMNPNKYKCLQCSAIAGRYCLGQDLNGKWLWGWMCLKCRPYIEPERN